jgi:thiol-disulfide isomerase/thioredoxin
MRPGTSRGRAAVRFGALLTVLVAGTGLAGCSDAGSGGSGTNYVAGDGTITVVPAAKRQQPIELRGTSLEGVPIDLSTLRGSVVVLNVWGSWCPPCRKEATDLQAAATQLKAKGVTFVGINVREQDPAQALAFQKTFGVTYSSIADTDGQALLSLRGAVSPNAIPTTLVLDTSGRIAARISSATTTVTLVDLVDDVVSGKVTP